MPFWHPMFTILMIKARLSRKFVTVIKALFPQNVFDWKAEFVIFLIFGCMSEKYVVLVLEWGRWYCGLMPRTGWEERRLTAGRGLVQRLDIGQIYYKSWINAFTDILLCEYFKFKWVGQVSEFCSNLKLRFSTLPSRNQNYKRHIINK